MHILYVDASDKSINLINKITDLNYKKFHCTICDDTAVISLLHICKLPCLQVDNYIYDYDEACEWLDDID